MLLSFFRNLRKIQSRGSILEILNAIRRSHRFCSPDKENLDIPYIDLFENDPDTPVNIRDFCCGRKVILVGVPGAFTPVCTADHLPGYISRADEFKKMGVDEIACISVNDPYVMNAWGKYHNAHGKVRMLADTNGMLTRALDVAIELPGLGGIRSKRYSMVVANTRIIQMNLEPDGTSLSISSAEAMIV